VLGTHHSLCDTRTAPADARRDAGGSGRGRAAGRRQAAAIAGTAADCGRELRAVAAAGAELILFTPLFHQAEHAEVLAAEIIPQLS
jgi:hypothetical protein